jgi:protein-tyrosine phosphatase
MLGTFRVNLTKDAWFTIQGGPYKDCPWNSFGVRVAEEIRKDAEVVIPIQDFSVPTKKEMNKGMVPIVDAILQGKQVYVGCMGGKGRTGLTLAIIAKTFGAKNPIEDVRAQYYPHAVETEEQEFFVHGYFAPLRVTLKIWVFRLLAKIMKDTGNLTVEYLVADTVIE